jgi:uroporphyrin-3 C-methyltransferase
MTTSDPNPTENTSTGPTAAAPSTVPRTAPLPRGNAASPPRRGGALAGSILLGLVALGLAGFVGWRVWQLETNDRAGGQSLAELRQNVTGLQATVNGLRDERNVMRQRLGDADAVNRSLREEVLGMSERTRNLEDAVANLSERTLTGHDAMLLDEAESLLRMAKERYALFHDASGAANAYELADRSLAGIDDAAFSAVRQSLNAEREALVAIRPASRDGDLAALAALREALPGLPLKPLDKPDAADAQAGFWQRAGHALAGVISVRRDDGAPIAAADGRLAREMAVLDVAHAEAALLAYDDSGRRAALQRVDAALASQFDGDAPAVRTARARVASLLANVTRGPEPQLGAALTELRNLRSVHALKPPASTTAPAPAPATSTHGPEKNVPEKATP